MESGPHEVRPQQSGSKSYLRRVKSFTRRKLGKVPYFLDFFFDFALSSQRTNATLKYGTPLSRSSFPSNAAFPRLPARANGFCSSFSQIIL
jgi:hypothetical protein